MVSRGGASGRWVGHEGRALINEMITLTKGTQESALAPPNRCGHSKMTIYETGSRPSLTRRWVCQQFDLAFPSLQDTKNKYLLIKQPNLWYYCYSSLNKLKTALKLASSTFLWPLTCRNTAKVRRHWANRFPFHPKTWLPTWTKPYLNP